MKPTVFISSTIEDLHHVRDAVRETISELGYQPIMSEYGGVGYMNEMAADIACYRSVKECQLMVLIIGKRYGSKTNGSSSVSVTEREYDTCMEYKPRLITFVDKEVLSYKRIYDDNPTTNDMIAYPGMDDAVATFNFINKVKHSTLQNAIIPFSSVSDVRFHLKQQLAGLFYDLLEQQANPEKSRLDEIMAEVKTIRNALSKKSTPDMRYLTIFKFLLDDRNQAFSKFLQHSIDEFENAIPIIYVASDFDDFMGRNNISIKVIEANDCFDALKDKNNITYASSFLPGWIIDASEESLSTRCSYAVYRGGGAVLNNKAYAYFKKAYADLKKRVDRIDVASSST